MLNELEFYHVVSGLPADIAHDLFEGVIPEVLGEVIKCCVAEGYFTIEYLNERIKYFPYAGTDRTNKPCMSFGSVHDLKVKVTACQAWCFLRMLPLMVGHCVPQHSEAWAVLLHLLDVTEYSATSLVTGELAATLADLVEEFLAAYFSLFPDATMKPKFHYLVHYPDLLMEYGPLVNVWTLRFEGKHNYFKELSKLTKNTKNLCKTLARRHEFMQASFRSRPNFLSQDVLHHSNGELYPIRLLPHGIEVALLPLVGPSESVYTVSKVQVNGTWYEVGLAVIVGSSRTEYSYQFAEIDKCFIIGGEVYLACRKQCKESEYIPHVHAFSVIFGRSLFLMNQSNLHDHYPLPIYSGDNMQLITLRHFVPF